MTESAAVRDLRRKLGLAITIIIILIGSYFLLLKPGSKGYEIVVLNKDGSFSHNCICSESAQGDGGYRWNPTKHNGYCPPENHPVFKCPPN